jgi:hypothetical protein
MGTCPPRRISARIQAAVKGESSEGPRVNTRNGTATSQAGRPERHSKVVQRLVLLGVVFLFGGEAFCLLGPIQYERVVHLSCHAVFYAGAAFVCLGAVMHSAAKR